MNLLILFISATLCAWSLTGAAVRADSAGRRRIAKHSGNRRAAPRGGGLAIIVCLLLLWPLWSWPLPAAANVLLAAMAGLALVSWIDDHRRLWVSTRLAAQTVAVAIALHLVPDAWRLLPAVPLAMERALTLLAWLWLMNLTSFKDDVDGMAAADTLPLALGYVAVAAQADLATPYAPLAVVLAGAAGGYLVWNWYPARIVMSEVGSIPIGFLTGWLMLDLAWRGQPAAALILPMYFLADAVLTLVKGVADGARPWSALRTHSYQRAVQGGARPNEVVTRILLTNAALVVVALVSVAAPLPALAVAGAVTACLLLSLRATSRGQSPAEPA